MKFGAV